LQGLDRNPTRVAQSVAVAICPGSLILHIDGTVAGCTEDDETWACRGRDLRHEGDPVVCYVSRMCAMSARTPFQSGSASR
jgi:hypothetical protein